MQKYISYCALTLLVLTATPQTLAVNTPGFPACANPQGSVIASYQGGTHGIPGSTDTYTGADSVYQVNDTQVLQCFCPGSGAGIQTNWWVASSLSADQIEDLKASGWVYVPVGSVWGLTDDPYMAQNLSYSCLPIGGGNPNGGGDGLSDGRSDGKSSCPECTQPPRGGGQVLGASTGDVLGLATTGNTWLLYSVFAAAIAFLAVGIRRS